MLAHILSKGLRILPEVLENLIYDHISPKIKTYIRSTDQCDVKNSSIESAYFFDSDPKEWKYVLKNPYFRQLECFIFKVKKFDDSAFKFAALNGNLSYMKWLKRHKCKFSEFTMEFAIAHGSLKNIKWLIKNKCPRNGFTTVPMAIAKKNMKILKLLYYDLEYFNNPFNIAARTGNLDIIKYVYNRCNRTSNPINSIFENGEVDVTKWFLKEGFELFDSTFYWAAHDNNVDAMKLLRENNCPHSNNSYNWAAYEGNLGKMKKLKEKSYDFDKYTFPIAILNGNPDIIEWLEKNGCFLNEEYTSCAACISSNSKWILKYIDSISHFSLDELMIHGSLESLELIKTTNEQNGGKIEQIHPKVSIETIERAKKLGISFAFKSLEDVLMNSSIERFTEIAEILEN